MTESHVKEISDFLRRVAREGGGEPFKRAAEMVEANFLPWTCCRCKETFTEERGAGLVEGPLCMTCTKILAHYIEHPDKNPYPNSILALPGKEDF